MNLGGMSDEQLTELADEIAALQSRRNIARTSAERARKIIDDAAGELDRVAALWHSAERGGTGTPGAPVAWARPVADHDVWPLGSVVTHGGRTWTSPVSANSTEPGTPEGTWVPEQTGA